jgi:hypothetical protein
MARLTQDQKRLERVLVELYHSQPVAVDFLPYSPEFSGIVNRACQKLPELALTPRRVWVALVRARKGQRLGRLTTGPLASPEAGQPPIDVLAD